MTVLTSFLFALPQDVRFANRVASAKAEIDLECTFLTLPADARIPALTGIAMGAVASTNSTGGRPYEQH